MSLTQNKYNDIHSFFIQNLLFEPALKIIKILQKYQYTAYFAGGCVRDALLNKNFDDIDIVTNAQPHTVQSIFPQHKCVGAHFGVVLVYIDQQVFEVATFRKDGKYIDGRRPIDISFADEMIDAQRRDFTINGLFYNPLNQKIIDHINGLDDIEKRIIRCIRNPYERFTEDYLRIIRAIRFWNQLLPYQFTIEHETLKNIKQMSFLVKEIAKERIREEIIKICNTLHSTETIIVLKKTYLIEHLFLYEYTSRNLNFLEEILKSSIPITLVILLSTLYWDKIHAFKNFKKQFVLTNQENKLIQALQKAILLLPTILDQPLHVLKHFMIQENFNIIFTFLQCWVNTINSSLTQHLECLDSAYQKYKDKLTIQPLITGNDLIKKGITPSPIFKFLLQKIKNAQLDEVIHSKEEALLLLENLINLYPKDQL